MMKQFREIKQTYPDALLLFRCGDFYETYMEDAISASKILGITLTHRSNGGTTTGAPMEMAGFPFHALDNYLPKLVRAGMRVAICDQLEDPKLTKKLVKRGVTELVTPGVSYSDTTLSTKENNWVCCIHRDRFDRRYGVSFLDISTGEFLVAEGAIDYIDKLMTNFAPKEVLFLRGRKAEFEAAFGARYFTFELDDWMLTEQAATDRLTQQFKTATLKGFGVDQLPLAVIAAGGILHYLDMTQHLTNGHIQHLSRIEEERYVWLDSFTIRNLELTGGQREGSRSLFSILDETCSPMGARMLHRWISLPLKSVAAIRNRQAVVEHFFRHPDDRDTIRTILSEVGDLERIGARISTGRIGPRDMLQLGRALQMCVPVRDILLGADNTYLQQLGMEITLAEDMRDRILHTITPNPPLAQGKPNTILTGVNDELDDLRNIQANGKEYLLRIQQREIEQTGIQSLKIGYNSVFGYYLEVRNTYKDQVPANWIRKQTLVGAERYITEELKEYEQKIVSAEEKIAILECRIYQELMLALQDYVSSILRNANILAQIDCLLSFATVAQSYRYICPDVNDSLTIDIRQGRHPVIERQLPLDEQYVANDVLLSNDDQQIVVITGPNMAGKSALLRQTALIVLMAQIGSFVPAESARIGVVDKIFTRVGASDNLSRGESTFMVEMTEAASILNNLSQRSLVLFDELGRGTSTYDGISIAWAIVEYIHQSPLQAKTLFATHYHELNEMADTFPRIRNFNVSVREQDGKVIFLRRLVPGGSEHSFGIHVAKIAGMPNSIVSRANEILHDLESHTDESRHEVHIAPQVAAPNGTQLSIFQLDDPVLEQIRDELKTLDINNLTPLEALNRLSQIRQLVGG